MQRALAWCLRRLGSAVLTSWGIDHGIAVHQGPQIVKNIAVHATEHVDQAAIKDDVLIMRLEAKKEVGLGENR